MSDLRRTTRLTVSRGRTGRFVVALASLLFIGFAFVYQLNFIQVLRSTGEGSGVLSIVAIGIVGGYAVSGRGPLWGRITSGITASGLVAVFSVGVVISGGWAPAEACVGLTFAVLMVLWIGACSIPHQEIGPAPD